MLFEPSYLSSNFVLTPGNLNPASSNPAQISKFIMKKRHEEYSLDSVIVCLQFIVSLKDSMYPPRTSHLLLIKTRCVYGNSYKYCTKKVWFLSYISFSRSNSTTGSLYCSINLMWLIALHFRINSSTSGQACTVSINSPTRKNCSLALYDGGALQDFVNTQVL